MLIELVETQQIVCQSTTPQTLGSSGGNEVGDNSDASRSFGFLDDEGTE